ncbi:hypothetical protein F4680DRAFT_365412 [Xylaria scruposa]|nr:hypothetical protein F4680DRAFT_365412 [Xylaria scruposa]
MLKPLLIVLTLQCILQISSFATATQQKCYYPGGNPTDEDFPCGDGVNHSHCCGLNSICLSNKLCLHPSGSFELSRGSCTDSTWQSSNCPTYCTNVSTNSGIPLTIYDFVQPMLSRYCCGAVALKSGSSYLECTLNQPFTLEPGEMISNRGILRNYILAGSENSNSTCPSNCTSPIKTSSHTVLALGAGLGIPLGIFSIGTISWALWRRYYRRIEVGKARFKPVAAQPTKKSQPSEHGDTIFRPQAPGRMTELRHGRGPAELDSIVFKPVPNM